MRISAPKPVTNANSLIHDLGRLVEAKKRPGTRVNHTWSPHSLIIGMLMSSIKIVIFLPAGGP